MQRRQWSGLTEVGLVSELLWPDAALEQSSNRSRELGGAAALPVSVSSPKRRAWCVQDAAGECLSHVAHIVGQDRDPQAAIRLAKRMIVDGSMPTPEEAHAWLRAEQAQTRLGTPIIGDITRLINETVTMVTATVTKSLK